MRKLVKTRVFVPSPTLRDRHAILRGWFVNKSRKGCTALSSSHDEFYNLHDVGGVDGGVVVHVGGLLVEGALSSSHDEFYNLHDVGGVDDAVTIGVAGDWEVCQVADNRLAKQVGRVA